MNSTTPPVGRTSVRHPAPSQPTSCRTEVRPTGRQGDAGATGLNQRQHRARTVAGGRVHPQPAKRMNPTAPVGRTSVRPPAPSQPPSCRTEVRPTGWQRGAGTTGLNQQQDDARTVAGGRVHPQPAKRMSSTAPVGRTLVRHPTPRQPPFCRTEVRPTGEQRDAGMPSLNQQQHRVQTVAGGRVHPQPTQRMNTTAPVGRTSVRHPTPSRPPFCRTEVRPTGRQRGARMTGLNQQQHRARTLAGGRVHPQPTHCMNPTAPVGRTSVRHPAPRRPPFCRTEVRPTGWQRGAWMPGLNQRQHRARTVAGRCLLWIPLR